jgi:4-diphosphocytidyl-2-C-methyl-D-erythritol kinase
VTIKSFAKINLGLEVVRRRPDGYHDIRTLFQWIGLSDVLDIRGEPSPTVELEGNDPSIPWDAANLVFKAARALREKSGFRGGAKIRVTKNIPAGRGLAGGSSNAATTLFALNRLWGLGLSRQDLVEIGKGLGADVPYFLHGGLCLGEERGDRLTELDDLPSLHVVLALPPFPVLTPRIYGALGASSLTSPGEDSKISRFLKTRELGFLENRLEETIFRLYPQLIEYKSLFRNHGAELSLVTGSGSAVYGLFRDRERAERCLADARKRGEAVLTGTVARLQGWTELEAGVSPSGKAADFGSAIRGFESSRPSFDISTEETKD